MAKSENVKRVKCRDCENECFAYNQGYCTILDNANFKGKRCPFFKTDDQFMWERMECNRIIRNHELHILTKEYPGKGNWTM